MTRCTFCNLDVSSFYNEILEETNHFRIISGIGAITEGYALIIPKKHVYCMTDFDKETIDEYINIINIFLPKF